jgi:hypothetical protein
MQVLERSFSRPIGVERCLGLFVLVGLAVAVCAGISQAAENGPTTDVNRLVGSATATTQLPPLRPLHGVQLTGATGLRLLVSDDPPFLLNLDTGTMTPVTGLNTLGNPALDVRSVGRDAVVWVDRHTGKVPRAEIYLVRHGTTRATRIATGWEIASAASGHALWILSYRDAHHCALSEIGLDRRSLRSPRPVACSTRLIDSGSGPVLLQGGAVIDPASGHTLLHGASLWVIAHQRALTSNHSGAPLTLSDLRTGIRRRLPWPSRFAFTDQAVVQPRGGLVALDFATPAYDATGTQVTDVWLFDPTTGGFQHLPDMPAAVDLKFTSMAWTADGRLAILAGLSGGAAGRNLVAIWKPGQKQLAIRALQLPARTNGSDTFVAW